MRIHYLQHVPFEGLGAMEAWFRRHGHRIDATHLYRGEALPAPDAFDVLVVMGGPMGVGDVGQYPWLEAETRCIRAAIAADKGVLGVCLGAQLIATALGARVMPNRRREIGWFPITLDPAVEASALAGVFPPVVEVFHWHGDTFEIPAGATALARSAACDRQGFVYGDRVFALQFHLETTPEGARALIDHCGHELDGSASVQAAAVIMADPQRFSRIHRLLEAVLARLLGAVDR